MDTTVGKDGAGPALRVLRGEPTPEELAAVIAVISVRAADGAPPDQDLTSPWADPARNIPQMPRPGPSAWRSSTWPR